jgi:hypothetical protein
VKGDARRVQEFDVSVRGKPCHRGTLSPSQKGKTRTKLFDVRHLRTLLVLGTLLCGCATPKYIPDRNLIEDPHFTNWFSIRGVGGEIDDGKVQGVFPSSRESLGKPSWRIAQWGSKYNFADPAVTVKRELSKHVFQLENRSKRFTVDSRRGVVEMGLFASACYERPRSGGEYWPHLLISCPLTDTQAPGGHCRVENIKTLTLNLDCQLLHYEDKHPGADPALHAAQCLLHVVVQNLTRDDDGYGDMLWFGVPIFDNRREIIAEHFSRDGGKPDASGKFIFNMAHEALRPVNSTFYQEGQIVAGEQAPTIPTRADLIPWIQYAFQLARRNGFMQTTSYRDLHVSAVNLGWEMPGTYDATMRVSNLALIAQY